MNFDKKIFSEILIKIKDSYGSINQMAEKTEITAAYLSKLIRLMYNRAPSPEILKKIANNSKGITTYEELMQICGYSSPILSKISNFNFNKIRKDLSKLGLTDFQITELYNLFSDCYDNSTFEHKLSSFMDNFSIQKVAEIYLIMENFFEIQSVSYNKYKDILENEIEKRTNLTKPQYHMCPVYGKIAAGQPNWAEDCIEGYLPIEPNLMNIVDPKECFFLRVNGESMNQLVKNGAFALIRKTDFVENGEIAVVLVNGYDATLKKFTKQGDLIVLEPMSSDSSFTTQVYNKDTDIKVIGKYIGKMEMK